MNDYADRMARALGFMEESLRRKASLDDIAGAACLSSFHFERVFRAMTGESPLGYLRKRRLSAAFDELLKTDRPLIDIGLDYGYDSPAAFSRAFSARFGIAPSRLRRRGLRSISGYFPPMDAGRLAHRMKGGVSMEARIEDRGPIRLVGMKCANTARRNGIPALWDAFIRRALRDKALLAGGTYGVYIYDFSMRRDETSDDTPFEYLAACRAPEGPAPKGMVAYELPARSYAVFAHKGLLSELGKSYEYIYGTWFPESGRESLAAEHFEYHGPDFKGDFPDSITEIWIPLAR